MLTIEKIIFTIQQINNGSDTVLITEVRPMRKFSDGKPTDEVENIRYTCICTQNKYEQIFVKVQGVLPVITNEDLEAKGGTVKAKIKGFEGRFYKENKSGEYRFTAQATGVEVIA